ncbi:MAG: hypothetical protein OFPII_33690 [Osedax symbiont Rs1]|nr:MAG: hypothetical protein OFPII_33690 [Osedax symbiont Rs1]
MQINKLSLSVQALTTPNSSCKICAQSFYAYWPSVDNLSEN